ncbi:hypothetical protein MRB53_024064 [Persea americana]|uniref:Uncharacterized protein n=1 Tax=Persea americana TaxID=3435 RepID=A0ACC2LC12_PERAE|nr:hypothetical protein MRB53_024064 [Persea americana]
MQADIDYPALYKRATCPFYHLDEVAGAALVDVGDAGAFVDLRSDLLEYVFDVAVGIEGAARHEGGAVAGALLTAGDAHTDVENLVVGSEAGAALGVLVSLVAVVDDGISGDRILGFLRTIQQLRKPGASEDDVAKVDEEGVGGVVMRKTTSGKMVMREMLEEALQGSVWVWDLVRSVAEMRFPTGERRLLSATRTFMPLYGVLRRFWNLKLMASSSYSMNKKNRFVG